MDMKPPFAFPRRRIRSLVMALACVTLATSSALGATYYIDYAAGSDASNGLSKNTPWKQAPGMAGFSGVYVHSAGDRFIFKGGVTWPATTLPLTISYSGALGMEDRYVADITWFSGPSWSQPIFDGGGTASAAIKCNGRTHITVSDIRIINIGSPKTLNNKKAIDFQNCEYITFSNMRLAPETWIGCYIYATSPKILRSVKIIGNDISNTAMGVVIATAGGGAIYDDVVIASNRIHDFSSQIGGGVHGDGIHIWGQATDSTQYLTNLSINDNMFYGSFSRSFGTTGAMTALIYIENATRDAKIFNNMGSYVGDGTRQFSAMIQLHGNSGRGGGHQVYNNTFSGTVPGMSAAVVLGGVPNKQAPNCTFRNNSFSGMQYAYYVPDGSNAGLSIDYTIANVTSGQSYYVDGFKTFSQWRSLGFDINGSIGDPMLIVQPPSGVSASSR